MLEESQVRKFRFFIMFILLIGFLGLAGWYYLGTEQPAESTVKTVDSTETAQTTEASEPAAATPTLLGQIYVPEGAYDPDVESENDYVKLYEQATSDSTVMAKLHRGGWYSVLEQTTDWVKVKTDSGAGYVQSGSIKTKEVDVRSKPTALKDAVIVLDAGHGGIDSGANSPDGTLLEKNLTLKTAKALQTALEAKGATVVMTRDDDTYLPLKEISEKTNETNGDVFISLHYDNYDVANVMSGFTTYYYASSSLPLANAINTGLQSAIELRNVGVREGNFSVIRETYTPSILLELGYLNSDNDLAVITADGYYDQAAKGIIKGLEAYFAE